jgi:hypothetical protein
MTSRNALIGPWLQAIGDFLSMNSQRGEQQECN